MEGRAAQISLLCLAGHHAAALEMAKATLARAPENARAHAALGEALAGVGDEQQALQSFSSAVRADPTDTVCVRGYARHLARLGRYSDAAAAYKRIVGPGKGRVEDAVALAEALRRGADAEGAQRVLDEVMRRDPQSLEPLRQDVERRAASGDLAGAAEGLEQLLDKEQAPHPIALGAAEALVLSCGSSASLARACALVFGASGRWLQAVRLLLPALAREPGDVGVRRTLGLAYARLGAARLAKEHLLIAIERGAAGAEERFALGEVLVEQGELAEAVRVLQGAREAQPDDPEVRHALARALAARGQLEEAVRELRAAHELARGDEAALEDELDRITARAFEQQLEEIEGRLRLDGDDHEARLQLAYALAQQGELDEALAQLERVAEHVPARVIEVGSELLADHEEGTRGLILLLAKLLRRQGDTARSIELIEQQLAERPDDQELQLTLYESYGRGGRRAEALEGLRGLASSARPQLLRALVEASERVQAAVEDPEFFLPAARALRRLGDLDEALRVFGSYLKAVPGDTEARQECAQALENAGQWGEAYQILAPLAESLEQLSLVELEHLARVALRAGKASEAVGYYERALARHPDDLALVRGLEGARARQREQRIKELDDASSPDELMQLAGLFAEAGRDEEARGVLAQLGRTGENPELDYLRFCGEHFARSGQPERAEAAWRVMAALLNHAPGSDPFKAFLYRVAGLHAQAGDRRSARQALLEIQAHDPTYQDVESKLEALTDVVPVHGRPDERVVSLVEVDAPWATLFDVLRDENLSL
jgi:tetratricopeptide (TPR) repeat protein